MSAVTIMAVPPDEAADCFEVVFNLDDEAGWLEFLRARLADGCYCEAWRE